MTDDSKSKATKKKPKKEALKKKPLERVEASILHEKVVQDRIAGLTTKEICERHKMDRKKVWAICDLQRDRITKEVKEREEDRQEAINRAFDNENELIVKLYGKATLFLEASFDDAVEGVKIEKGKGEYSLEQRTETLQIAVKAFDRIKANMLAHQKLSMAPVENASYT